MNTTVQHTDAIAETGGKITNYRLLFYYSLPFIVYIAIGYLEDFLDIKWVYLLRLLIVPGIILWAWRWYRPLAGPKNRISSVLIGIIAGIAGTGIWLFAVAPFVKTEAEAWNSGAFYLRLAASTFVVPFFEEFLMRGYIFFLVLQWDMARQKGVKNPLDVALHECRVDDVKVAPWNTWAVIISTVAFASGHHMAEWPAAFSYGLIMAFLMIIRKDLLSCVVAHGTTNLCLGLYVFFTGNWQYW